MRHKIMQDLQTVVFDMIFMPRNDFVQSIQQNYKFNIFFSFRCQLWNIHEFLLNLCHGGDHGEWTS